MNMTAVQKELREIIDGMYRHFNYTIEDFSFIEGIDFQWGLSKIMPEGTKKFMIFTNVYNGICNGNFENYICSKLNCSRENLIKIVVTADNNDSSEIQNRLSYLSSISANENNIIILDLANRNIQITHNDMQLQASEMAGLLRSLARRKETRSSAAVTYTIIGINILVFIITAIASGKIMDIDVYTLVNFGAKYNPAIEQGEWYRLFTAMFLHGGLLHIAANMYSLYSIGPLVENLYGKYKYIIIYILSGIVSSFFSFQFSEYISVGASGAIFGLLGVIFAYAFKERKKIGKSFLMNVVTTLAINLYIGLNLPNIDNYAHLGGLLSGIVLGAMVSRAKE